jgi:hypothetical protein
MGALDRRHESAHTAAKAGASVVMSLRAKRVR